MNDPISDPPLDPARLRGLEHRVRWLSAMTTFLALATLAVSAWLFLPRRQVLDVHRLSVRDARGMRRIELGTDDKGQPWLRLNNPNQRARLMMLVRDDGRVTLRLGDVQGTHRLQLTLEEDGRPGVMLAAPSGRSVATLGVGEDGSPRISLRDRDLKSIWTAP